MIEGVISDYTGTLGKPLEVRAGYTVLQNKFRERKLKDFLKIFFIEQPRIWWKYLARDSTDNLLLELTELSLIHI